MIDGSIVPVGTCKDDEEFTSVCEDGTVIVVHPVSLNGKLPKM